MTYPPVGPQQVVAEPGQFLRQHRVVDVGQGGPLARLPLRLLLKLLPAAVRGEQRRLLPSEGTEHNTSPVTKLTLCKLSLLGMFV